MFIQEDLPLLQSFNYTIILPAWLKSITESKMRVRTSASVQSYNSATNLDEVLNFDWNFALGGQEIGRDAFQKLVEENREYIRSGDEWFHIDPLWLKKIKDIMDRADSGEWTVKDLLFHDIPEEIVPIESDEDEEDPLFEFSMQKSLKVYMEILADKKGLPSAGVSEQLHAELRPYQVEGYDWLIFMRDNQFGAVLAD
ncbi:hypothetical protein J4G37_41070, partial [Microvirga sp. 3-52]|nr:hypothetical protein [Microvirga sp. 3-52]